MSGRITTIARAGLIAHDDERGGVPDSLNALAAIPIRTGRELMIWDSGAGPRARLDLDVLANVVNWVDDETLLLGARNSLGDPLVMASLWLRGLSEMEQIHRAAAQVVDDIERVGKRDAVSWGPCMPR